MDESGSRAKVEYEPAEVPVMDRRQHVRGAKVRIEVAGQILETTVIPPEGTGPESWIGAARRVEEIYERGLITIKLALVEAANEGAQGKSGIIELGGPSAAPAGSELIADVQSRGPRSLPVEYLARLRSEAEALDARVPPAAARRATAAVMDVSVVLSLLDEVERLRRELAIHADDGSTNPGAIAAATLQSWRADAEREGEGDVRKLADRLLGAIDELERRRQGAAAALGGHHVEGGGMPDLGVGHA